RRLFDDPRLALPYAQAVDGLVAHDHDRPREGTAPARIGSMSLAPHVEKAFLQNVLGFSSIVDDFQGERVEAAGETIVEMRERPFIALGNAREQFDLQSALG